MTHVELCDLLASASRDMVVARARLQEALDVLKRRDNSYPTDDLTLGRIRDISDVVSTLLYKSHEVQRVIDSLWPVPGTRWPVTDASP